MGYDSQIPNLGRERMNRGEIELGLLLHHASTPNAESVSVPPLGAAALALHLRSFIQRTPIGLI